MTTIHIENLDTLIQVMSTLLVKKPENLNKKNIMASSVFTSRKYSELVDKLLLYHANNKSIKELVKDLNDPLKVYDLSVVLESLVDVIDYGSRDYSIGYAKIDRLIDKLDGYDERTYIRNYNNPRETRKHLNIYNYDEEVLF